MIIDPNLDTYKINAFDARPIKLLIYFSDLKLIDNEGLDKIANINLNDDYSLVVQVESFDSLEEAYKRKAVLEFLNRKREFSIKIVKEIRAIVSEDTIKELIEEEK